MLRSCSADPSWAKTCCTKRATSGGSSLTMRPMAAKERLLFPSSQSAASFSKLAMRAASPLLPSRCCKEDSSFGTSAVFALPSPNKTAHCRSTSGSPCCRASDHTLCCALAGKNCTNPKSSPKSGVSPCAPPFSQAASCRKVSPDALNSCRFKPAVAPLSTVFSKAHKRVPSSTCPCTPALCNSSGN